MTEQESEERFAKLEMKLSYMEDFVNQIQEVAVGQAKTIELLQKEVKLMASKIHEMSDTLEGEIPSRKPPHY